MDFLVGFEGHVCLQSPTFWGVSCPKEIPKSAWTPERNRAPNPNQKVNYNHLYFQVGLPIQQRTSAKC